MLGEEQEEALEGGGWDKNSREEKRGKFEDPELTSRKRLGTLLIPSGSSLFTASVSSVDSSVLLAWFPFTV